MKHRLEPTVKSIGRNFRIETWAGDGSYENKDGVGTKCSIYWPYEIKFDSAGVGYFTAFGSASVRRITPDGTVSTITDRTTSGQRFTSVRVLTLDRQGNIYIADTGNHRIRKIYPNGTCETVLDTMIENPYGIVVADDGTLYVSSGAKIYEIADGKMEVFAGTDYGNVDGIGTEAKFALPQGMELDTEGNIIVADCRNNSIRKIDRQRKVTTIATGFKNPYGVVLDKRGNIYVADYGFHDIKRITKDDQVQSIALHSEFSSDPKFLSYPTGVSLDPNGFLVVCDCYNHIIRKVKWIPAAQASQWPHCDFLPCELKISLLEIMCILIYKPPLGVPKDLVLRLTKTVIRHWPF
jgi:sugar lactone lactonase YvrE